MDGSEVNLFSRVVEFAKAPTREIRENKTPAKYMAYTVLLCISFHTICSFFMHTMQHIKALSLLLSLLNFIIEGNLKFAGAHTTKFFER